MAILNYGAGYRDRVKASSSIAYCLGSQEAIVMGINALTLTPILMKKDTTFKDAVIPSATVSGSQSLRSQAFRGPPWQIRRLARAIPRDLPTRYCQSILYGLGPDPRWAKDGESTDDWPPGQDTLAYRVFICVLRRISPGPSIQLTPLKPTYSSSR